MYQDLIRNELNEAAETLANFLKDDANIHAIQRAAVLLADSFKAGGKVLSCGNGGSHRDGMYFARREEGTCRYREQTVKGGKMAGTADIEIRVPHFGYADRIQEIHIKVIHILIQLIEKEMVK